MSIEEREKRLEVIRNGLKRGDRTRIARLANVRYEWVWWVLTGRGKSERVLAIAEQVIADRALQKRL